MLNKSYIKQNIIVEFPVANWLLELKAKLAKLPAKAFTFIGSANDKAVWDAQDRGKIHLRGRSASDNPAQYTGSGIFR